MEKMERLRIQSVKGAEKKRGRAAAQQDLDSMKATCDSSVALDKTRETEGGHKSSQSSGGSYQTCPPEQKSIEPNPAQGQGVELLLGGGSSWYSSTMFSPKVDREHRLMDMCLTYGWMNSNKNTIICSSVTNKATWGTRKHKVEERLQDKDVNRGWMVFPGGNSGPIGRCGRDGVAPQGYKANSGSTTMLSGNPGQVLPQQQAMPPAAPHVLGKMQPETLRTVELVKPDRKSTTIGFSRNRGDEYVIASSAN